MASPAVGAARTVQPVTALLADAAAVCPGPPACPVKSMFGGHFLAFKAPSVYQTPRVRIGNMTRWQDSKGAACKEYIHFRASDGLIESWLGFEHSIQRLSGGHWPGWFGADRDPAATDFCSTLYGDASGVDEDGAALLIKFGTSASAKAPTRYFSPDGVAMPLDTTEYEPRRASLVGQVASLVVAVEGLWFAKGKYGVRYNLLEVKLHSQPASRDLGRCRGGPCAGATFGRGAAVGTFAFVEDD